MTKTEWLEKFGGGRKIKRDGFDEEVEFDRWYGNGVSQNGDEFFLPKDRSSDDFRETWTADSNWIVVEEKPEFKEKSLEDLPLVEVRDRCCDKWRKMRYSHTNNSVKKTYVCFDKDGFIYWWNYMHQTKPTNIAQLKKSAYLC